MIMHDGENLFNESTSFGGVAWNVQDAADDLILASRISDVIIAGVDNTASRIYEYTYSEDSRFPGGGGADVYLDFLESHVIPLVRGKYRISSNETLVRQFCI